MARANRASYKTCFVFRIHDEWRNTLYLKLDGAFIAYGTGQRKTEELVKCFDKESAESIAKFINNESGCDHTIEVEETECDIVQELQLYSFVEAFVHDLRKAKM